MEQIVRISAVAEKCGAKGYALAPTANGSGRGWLGLMDEAGNLVHEALLLSSATFTELNKLEEEDRDEAVLNLRLMTVTTKDGTVINMATRDFSSNIFAGAEVRHF